MSRNVTSNPKDSARRVLGITAPFVRRGREAGEAPGVLILPMKLPVFDLHKHLAQRSGIAITS